MPRGQVGRPPGYRSRDTGGVVLQHGRRGRLDSLVGEMLEVVNMAGDALFTGHVLHLGLDLWEYKMVAHQMMSVRERDVICMILLSTV